jgi:hypothetical protein
MTTRALIGVSICAVVIGVAILVSGSAKPLWAFLVLPFVADSL